MLRKLRSMLLQSADPREGFVDFFQREIKGIEIAEPFLPMFVAGVGRVVRGDEHFRVVERAAAVLGRTAVFPVFADKGGRVGG